ncbi:1-acyl-sn-glycerol-3-phosphate acyltransferase alpha-like [Pecten maximus]|uniref:1-acyl-sn-glycerol-3-phosphate acyltransferase alpha-like n=1 Tax=Pecten maximus TaxID=6579 RepID=UPI001458315E|nr:1-acyl-sn-glycerol-3-phosphate acyltransferase alpha-like [Pecten maximus]
MAVEWFQWTIILFLLLLPVLYELNNTFKYYAKFALYFILNMIISGLIAIFLIPRVIMGARNPENYKYPAFVVNLERRLFGLSIDVRGRENLEAESPCIIVINHQSSLDLFGLMEIWPKRCSVLAKKSLMYMGPLGLLMWLLGAVFVDRVNHSKAVSTLSEASKHIKKEKISIIIFPEGTRNHEPTMLPFKKGAFHLAVLSQIPVVPVVFSSYSDFYNKKEKNFSAGKFIITCLPPISTEGKKLDEVSEMAESVREQMMEVFNQTSSEGNQTKSTQAKLVNNQ